MQHFKSYLHGSASTLAKLQPRYYRADGLIEYVALRSKWRTRPCVVLKQHTRGFRVRPVVAEALRQRKPVVALESTIITHGMPYPQNIRTAFGVERVIRDQAAIPATVGIIEGELIVGLTEDEINFLGEPDNGDSKKIKTSRRDLAHVLSQGLSGGTTVSGTMIAAQKAGIPIFVTGGIGGVHRGANESFDISADLTELGKTPIAVVCAGIKSILDIGLTLEYLETQGVTVVTYGHSKEFPAFFTPKSGFQAPYNSNSPQELACLVEESLSLGLNNGLVIGVPIPQESSSVGEEIEGIILKALEEARQRGIIGKNVTPFVLERVNEMSGGKSLETNIALIENNARVGAQIAVELSKIERSRLGGAKVHYPDVSMEEPFFTTNIDKTMKEPRSTPLNENKPVIIGGSVFDLLAVTDSYDVLAEVTNKGKLYQTFGGVGRNIAECVARLGVQPLLISAMGKDSQGDMMLEHLQKLNMDTRGILVSSDVPTASYSAIMNNSGELLLAVGDMHIHEEIKQDFIQDFEDDIKKAPIVCIDGNLDTSVIERALQLCIKHDVPVWYDPTDMTKATKPFSTEAWRAVTYVSPNKRELQALHAAICNRQEGMENFNSDGSLDFSRPTEDQVITACIRMSRDILPKVTCLVITLGRFGVLVLRNELCDEPFPVKGNMTACNEKAGLISATHYPSVNEDIVPDMKIRSVSGAGDSLAGTMIASIIRGDEPHICVKAGLRAAFLSLQTHDAVSDQVIPEKFTVDSVTDWTTLSPRDIAV
eukprot:gene12071-13315_t